MRLKITCNFYSTLTKKTCIIVEFKVSPTMTKTNVVDQSNLQIKGLQWMD